jgi:hypothetical protein
MYPVCIITIMGHRLERLDATVNAGVSVIESLPMISNGKFACLSVAALYYVSRQCHLPLDRQRSQEVCELLGLGVQINDHYDTDEFSRTDYKTKRQKFRSDPEYLTYYKTIRQLERNRPSPGQTQECISYRENTNLVSLSISCSRAFECPISSFVTVSSDNSQVSFSSDAPPWFRSLFYAVSALQVVDDVIGCYGDSSQLRPSYFTAFGSLAGVELQSPDGMKKYLPQTEALYNGYLQKAVDADPDFIFPVELAAKVVHGILPNAVFLVRQQKLANYFTDILLTKRDSDRN